MSSNLQDFLDDVAEKYGDRDALLFKPGFKYVSWSYRELAKDSRKAATLLKDKGLEKGDTVVIWAPNSPVWVISFFACLRVGVIAVPLDMRSSEEFVKTILSKTNPKLAIVSRSTPKTHVSIGVPLLYMEDMPIAYDLSLIHI